MNKHFQVVLKPVTLAVATMILVGCSSLNPSPLTEQAVRDRAAQDRVKMFDQQEPIEAPISMDEAIARALKYNLDLRLKKMEVAVNGQLHSVSKYDMLPNLVVGAGYMDRSNYSGGGSWQFSNQSQGAAPSSVNQGATSYSTSSEMAHKLGSVEFSWNVLDFGVSYYRAKQRADEFLMAQERKSRVIQTTVHDVRFAFLRALAAQRLTNESEIVLRQANVGLEMSRAAEARGVIPVQTALSYQRALVDAVALLNSRRQELDFAKAELAALMSAPSTKFTLADQPEQELSPVPTNLDVLEDTALLNRPELREEDYKKRISAAETRRQLMQAFPNLTFGLGAQYDSNKLLYNNHWVEDSARLSWNLLRVLSAPAVKEAGERQLEADDARRYALSMAVMTQTRIAALRYGLAKNDLDLAQKGMEVDERMAAVARAGVNTKAESELELVRANARAVVSKYQRAIAYANAQAAYARVQHSLGQSFDFGDFDHQTVAEVAQHVGETMKASKLQLPTPLLAKAGPRPKVALYLDDEKSGQVLLAGVTTGLTRGGFDVVAADVPDALKLRVSLNMVNGSKGLKRGEVLLAPVGADNTISQSEVAYTAVLPQEPRNSTFNAMGEAAATAHVGNLREWIAKLSLQ